MGNSGPPGVQGSKVWQDVMGLSIFPLFVVIFAAFYDIKCKIEQFSNDCRK